MLQDMLKFMVLVKPGEGEFTHFCSEYLEGKYAHLDPEVQALRESRRGAYSKISLIISAFKLLEAKNLY